MLDSLQVVDYREQLVADRVAARAKHPQEAFESCCTALAKLDNANDVLVAYIIEEVLLSVLHQQCCLLANEARNSG